MTAVCVERCVAENQQTHCRTRTGRTIIEERGGEFEGILWCLTQDEEKLTQKSCLKTRRGAESELVQPGICATKTGPEGQKQRIFQEKKMVLTFERQRLDVRSLPNCDGFRLTLLFFPRASNEKNQYTLVISNDKKRDNKNE